MNWALFAAAWIAFVVTFSTGVLIGRFIEAGRRRQP